LLPLMNLYRPLVSIVVPVFNEAGIVTSNLNELLRYTQTLPAYRFEYIVVNDGSSDNTAELVEAIAAAHPSVTAVHHLTNRGLGAALRTGFEHAHGDIIVSPDIDLSYAPDYIATLVQALVNQQADIAIASPYLKGGAVRNVPWLRKAMSSWANRYLSVATGGAIATLTGMVRAYDARSLRTLNVVADGMAINHEIVFEALKRRMRVVEIPAILEWRTQTPDVDATAAAAPARRSSMRIGAHIWSVLASGLRHRPALALALPALIPGFLPFVLMIVLTMRPSHAVIVDTTLVTLVVQFSSLGFLVVMTGSYIRRLRSITRRARLQDGGTQSSA
jgi:hypothetical protein